MGFDITAEDLKGKEVAYHRAYMGGFRMMAEQGYDWFTLIDANECYAGVSGNGDTKKIQLKDLKYALEILLRHIPIGLANNGLGDEKDLRDEFNDRKPRLKEFMDKCIKWCKKNNQDKISINFS